MWAVVVPPTTRTELDGLADRLDRVLERDAVAGGSSVAGAAGAAA